MNSLYLYIIIGVICLILLVLLYLKLNKSYQQKIKDCLLYLVLKAESQLGEDTGKIKRSLVYGWIKEKFPKISLFISQKTFDKILDATLEIMREQLQKNTNLITKLDGNKN